MGKRRKARPAAVPAPASPPPTEELVAVGKDAALELASLMKQLADIDRSRAAVEASARSYARGLLRGLGIDPERFAGVNDETYELILKPVPEPPAEASPSAG